MATVTAQWAEFNGKTFEKDAEIVTIEARETPRTLFVSIPKRGNAGGAVIRLPRFGRYSGNTLTNWRHYYGRITRKYIDFTLVASAPVAAKPPRLTIAAVNKAITALGIKAELVKGNGYFYFAGEDVDLCSSTSVSVYRLNELTLEDWISEAISRRDEQNEKLS